MSSQSFAALRQHRAKELVDLAEEHFKHDLNEDDRQKLQSAGSTISTYAAVGSVLGLGLGAYMAFRFRRGRAQMFAAMRAQERPTHVQFANGRTEPLPDMTPYMKPSTLGDVAAYTFFGAGGLFLFGETGGVLGGYMAKKSLFSDMEAQKRIETAFRRFRADVLKREVQELEKPDSIGSKVGDMLS